MHYKIINKKAVITGITGQDGSYLAELLLEKNYEVFGFVRRESFESSLESFKNIEKIKNQVNIIPVSITDPLNVYKEIQKILPDELYHLAAHSFVSYDMGDDINIMDVNFYSTLYITNAVKELCPHCKIFFAGSSEMFGNPPSSPQNEKTRFNPRSIYGIAKLASYYLLNNMRLKNKIFTAIGIMYNHESIRRGNEFVTKKIISTAVKIKFNQITKLELGNLDARRDWGYAPDYVYAMWLMLQQKKPDTYIVATGNLSSVKEFMKITFDYLDIDYKQYLHINKQYFRPSENIPLCGDATKIKNIGWKNTKNLKEIIIEMIEQEIEIINK